MDIPRARALVLAAGLGISVLAAGCGSLDSGNKKNNTTTTGGQQPAARTDTNAQTTNTTPSGEDTSQQTSTTSADSAANGTADIGTPGATNQAGSSASTAATSDLGASQLVFRPFSLNSPWNTLVDRQPVDNRSDRLIRLSLLRLGAIEGDSGAGVADRVNQDQLLGNVTADALGTRTDTTTRSRGDTITTTRRSFSAPLFINTTRWTTPVVSVTNGTPTQLVCRQANLPPPNNFCGDGWLVSSLNIPADENPLPKYDGWFTVVDRARGFGYDFWRARRERDGGSMSYQFLRRWNLNGPGFLAPTFPSARGSGLPLFGGLVQPEEVRAGQINHALAISVPGPAQRRYVQPASVTDGNGETSALPEGARIRLKSSVSLRRMNGRVDPRCRNRRLLLQDGLTVEQVRKQCRPYKFPGRTNRRATNAILTALKRYGAIVVDRAQTPTLYAEFDRNWRRPLRDFRGRVLDERGRRLRGGRARLPNQGTPLLRGSEVSGLFLTDFEVLQLPALRIDPPLQEVPVTPLFGGATPQSVPTRQPAPRRRATPQRAPTTTQGEAR